MKVAVLGVRGEGPRLMRLSVRCEGPNNRCEIRVRLGLGLDIFSFFKARILHFRHT